MSEILGSKQSLLLRRLGRRPKADLAIGLLTTGRRMHDAYNELLVSQELSGGRFAALLAVDETPGITPARLADELEVRRATVTGLIDGLVKRDLLVRGSDESDRRVQTLTITEAGKRRLEEIVPIVDEWLSNLTSGLDENDEEAAWRIMRMVLGNLNSGIGVS